MKFCFKYHSNTSFRIYPANESAGYSVEELKNIYRIHLETELSQLEEMSNQEFLEYFGATNIDKFVGG